MPNTFLFVGEETTMLSEQLTVRKEKFLSKYGDSGLFERKGDDQSISDLQNSLLGGGFFATKKLIIIHGIPKDNLSSYALPASVTNKLSLWLIKHREQIPEEHVVILVSRKPDKRTSDYKTFSKLCTIKEFKPLSSSQRLATAKQSLGSLLTTPQLERLAHVAPSYGLLMHEISKIKLYCERNGLDALPDEAFTLLVTGSGDDNAFVLLDYMIADRTKALAYLDQLKDQGSDTFQTLGMLYWGLKIIIGMIDSRDAGITSSKAIASRIKAPPFTISKFAKHKQIITQDKQYRYTLFQQIVTLDHALKTGVTPPESFWVRVKTLLYIQ